MRCRPVKPHTSARRAPRCEVNGCADGCFLICAIVQPLVLRSQVAFGSGFSLQAAFWYQNAMLAPQRWGTMQTELGISHSSWKGSLLLSTPATAACLASKQTAYLSLSCLRGSERYAACFDEVVARTVRFSQPAALSALLVIQLSGIVIPPPYFPLRAPKGALRPLFGRSAPSLLFVVRSGLFCC